MVDTLTELIGLRISLASPEQINKWSYGEVTKPETINYRTLRPEKDGLFCERIFGPTKDWECFCGKFKKIQHRGVICDRCGVEVTRSRVRRERMGHIKLAAPVAHIWFSKGTPSHIGLLLDITPRNLERVLYFSQYVITNVNHEERERIGNDIEDYRHKEHDRLDKELKENLETDDLSDALATVQKVFEEKGIAPAELSKTPPDSVAKFSGTIELIDNGKNIRLISKDSSPISIPTPNTHRPTVKSNMPVFKGEPILQITQRAHNKKRKNNDAIDTPEVICAPVSGIVSVTKNEVIIFPDASEESHNMEYEEFIYEVPSSAEIFVKDGAQVNKGDALTSASDKGRLEFAFKILKNDVDEKVDQDKEDIASINILTMLTEARYNFLQEKFGSELFSAGMGAESIMEILQKINLSEVRSKLRLEVHSTSGQKQIKSIKRLRLVESLLKSTNKPEWMILTILPVLPPELHPMVQLDGGRFAASDLNDLYRRVINRNNRLKHLINIQAPEIITRNEKRMLQEAVDSLIDNGRRGRAVQGTHNHQLKSLTDLLRGKQGRFRQNLLGKRVDYSGRSVIVSGPDLKLHQCGLPRYMAIELFKPFVMRALVLKGHAHNIKSAKRIAENPTPQVWDILEEVIKNHPVLLNRAPTLHRLGIQAFQPILVDGSAIRLHPLVCAAFNADFDGDQMAVHVPLSRSSVIEAHKLMLSTNNLLAPRSGDPIVAPTLDMVVGIYHLTGIDVHSGENGTNGNGAVTSKSKGIFSDCNDALLAHNAGVINLRQLVSVREKDGSYIETTPGRIIFNQQLPDIIGFRNYTFGKTQIEQIVAECHAKYDDNQIVADMLDRIKDVGFKYATIAGITISMSDIKIPHAKSSLLSSADKKINTLEEQYQNGLITDDDKYRETVRIWTEVSNAMTREVEAYLPKYKGIYDIAASGAKGNIAQIKQMAGMRGLMSDPKGRIIEMPIRSSFAEGLSVMEYFISTHGARKGLADTAIRTADAGYLTRRLADVAQDVIILEKDCGMNHGLKVYDSRDTQLNMGISERIVSRYLARPILHPTTKELLADTETLISAEFAREIEEAGVTEAYVRSPITCEAIKGLCSKCYGASLASNRLCMIGEAMGIIAAQSIGEPGTQLTMRTFHTGGIAAEDITSGLPRVVELFEVRSPKGLAPITEVGGTVKVLQTPQGRIAQIVQTERVSKDMPIPPTHRPVVKTGDKVYVGDPIFRLKSRSRIPKEYRKTSMKDEITAEVSGDVTVRKENVLISWEERNERAYPLPAAARILVSDDDVVEPGYALTTGPKDPKSILAIEGSAAAQRYLIDEVQSVYRSQGVRIHDKHIEVVIRQMMRKVMVDTPGDTDLLPGETIDRLKYNKVNIRTQEKEGRPATARPTLMGITRSALAADSFMAAASFQETARVLTDAAIGTNIDRLKGLKENVIIGHLIPARLDRTEEGRKFLGINESAPSVVRMVDNAPRSYKEAVTRMGMEAISEGQASEQAETFLRRDTLDKDIEAQAATEALLETTEGFDNSGHVLNGLDEAETDEA